LTANPIGIVVVALAALTAGIIYAYQNSEEFRGIVDGLFGVLKGAAESTLPALKVAFDAVSGAIVWAAGEAGKLWNTINDLIGKITEFIGKIAGIPGSIGINIPGLAGGTTSFGGGLAVVGERGPELVNLPRGSSVTPLGGRGAPVTVNVYVQGSVVTERQLIDTVYDGLIQKQRSNYSLGWV
jgi:phage-related protein